MTFRIIDRLEQVTEDDLAMPEPYFGMQAGPPIRGLEYAIHQAMGWQDNDECGWSHEATGRVDPSPDWPHYCTSIDAALTLVPEGWEVSVDRYRDGKGDCTVCKDFGKSPKDFYSGDGATPAIALCIAALRARGLGE